MRLTAKLVGVAVRVATASAGAAVVLSGNTARADPTPTGLEVGLRTGFALPLGSVQQSLPLRDTVNGTIPIWIDAGYRFHPNAMIGAFFQYGIGLMNSDGTALGMKICGSSDNCSVSDIVFGLQFQYHLMPDATFDPWGGVGFGYEILGLDDPGTANNTGAGGASYSGFQFANLQIGGDYKVMPNLGLGPFMMFSLGEYSGCSYTALGNCAIQMAMHEVVHPWHPRRVRTQAVGARHLHRGRRGANVSRCRGIRPGSRCSLLRRGGNPDVTVRILRQPLRTCSSPIPRASLPGGSTSPATGSPTSSSAR